MAIPHVMTVRRGLAASGLLAVMTAALLVRTGLMTAPPEFDELYHVLAARSLLETGHLAILDGEYVRAQAFTQAVAGVMALLDDRGITTARLVSLAAGCAIPAVFFVWVRGVAGFVTGLVAAGLLVVWPQGILEAQMARFYAAHVLCFSIGAVALWQAVHARGAARINWAGAAALAWGLALHLQVSTAIGIAGALLWVAPTIAFDRIRTVRGRIVLIAAVAILIVAAVAAAWATGLLAKGWAVYRWTPLHAMDTRDYAGFYQKALGNAYPVLWYATPVLAALAWRRRPHLASYCAAIFAVCFLVHSFGGMKALRYLSYATPFLFVLWAIAVIAVAEAACSFAARAGLRPAVCTAAAALGFALALASGGAVPQAVAMARGEGIPPRGDWSRAAHVIGDWIDAPFHATTRELHMIYALGGYDVLISAERITEITPREDYADDFRTGRPVIGSDDALAAMVACERDGLLVTSPFWWEVEGNGAWVEAALADAGLSLDRRRSGAVLAVRWYDPNGRPPDCSGVPGGRIDAAD